MAVPPTEPLVRLQDACKKTKMCRFHLSGGCMKQGLCRFAHDAAELKSAPDLRRTKICQALIKSGECRDPGCTFAHSREELRLSPSATASFKTKLCQFFVTTGRCKLGSRCNFAHHAGEARGGGTGAPLPEEHERPGAPPRARGAPGAAALAAYESLGGVQLFRPPPGLEDELGLWGRLSEAGAPPLDGPAYVALPALSGPWDSPAVPPRPPRDAAGDAAPLGGAPGRHLGPDRASQRDGVLSVEAKLAGELPGVPDGLKACPGPLRSVGTSESTSTLCSLSDRWP
mmetsp:Transcript_13194/g.37456  ORF Transcript_13194/g.37456 Transcript_13194/m.37456 type:complete len:286 (-) Transcript_13194:62-919(-)